MFTRSPVIAVRSEAESHFRRRRISLRLRLRPATETVGPHSSSRSQLRNPAEHGQRDVDPCQIAEDLDEDRRLIAAQSISNEPKNKSQNQTRHRSDDSDLELGSRISCFLGQARNAAKNKQGDLRDLYARAHGHERMRKLMRDDRKKEENGGEQSR